MSTTNSAARLRAALAAYERTGTSPAGDLVIDRCVAQIEPLSKATTQERATLTAEQQKACAILGTDPDSVLVHGRRLRERDSVARMQLVLDERAAAEQLRIPVESVRGRIK